MQFRGSRPKKTFKKKGKTNEPSRRWGTAGDLPIEEGAERGGPLCMTVANSRQLSAPHVAQCLRRRGAWKSDNRPLGSNQQSRCRTCMRKCRLRLPFLCFKNESTASSRPSRGRKQLQRQRGRAALVSPAGDGGSIRIWKVAIEHSRPNRRHDQPPGVVCRAACRPRFRHGRRVPKVAC